MEHAYCQSFLYYGDKLLWLSVNCTIFTQKYFCMIGYCGSMLCSNTTAFPPLVLRFPNL